MRPYLLTAVVNRKIYRTEGATLIAHNAYYDGKSWERRGCNMFLYRTPKGSYFAQFQAASYLQDCPLEVKSAMNYMELGESPLIAAMDHIANTTAGVVQRGYDWIQPLSVDEALSLYLRLPEQEMPLEQAFPGIEIEEA